MATATKTKAKKQKKAKLDSKAKRIHIRLLLDESGSMGGNVQAVVDGTNEFVGSLMGEKNSKRARVGVSLFDQRPQAPMVRHLRDQEKLDDFELLTEADYNPRGMTPLNDAIMKTLAEIDGAMGKGDKALLVIFTDGHENASETSAKTVKKALKKAEKSGVTTIYLGANVDAQHEAGELGLKQPGQSLNFASTARGTRSALKATGNIGRSYLADGGNLAMASVADTYGDSIAEDYEDEDDD